MLSRSSQVKFIKIRNALFSSHLQIGDTKYIDGSTFIIAEQHEETLITQKKEEEITRIAKFPTLPPIPIINENISISTFNKKPIIYVDFIDVNSISAASIIAIGKTDHVRMISQIMDIRHLDKTNPNNVRGE